MPSAKRKICSLVNNFAVINQSECAMKKAPPIITTTVPPEILVTRCPRELPRSAPIIMPMPAETSPIATILLTSSGAGIPRLPNHPTIFSGGSGNLLYPCRKNATPSDRRNIQGANAEKGLANESRVEFSFMIIVVLKRLEFFDMSDA
jgi:hypothetical protein